MKTIRKPYVWKQKERKIENSDKNEKQQIK